MKATDRPEADAAESTDPRLVRWLNPRELDGPVTVDVDLQVTLQGFVPSMRVIAPSGEQYEADSEAARFVLSVLARAGDDTGKWTAAIAPRLLAKVVASDPDTCRRLLTETFRPNDSTSYNYRFLLAAADLLSRRSLEDSGLQPEELAELLIGASPKRGHWDEAIGPFFDTSGLKAWLHISRQRLHQLVKSDRVLAVETEDKHRLYPTFQFRPGPQLLPHLDVVLPILTTVYNGWDAALWLNSPLEEWDDQTAADLLHTRDETLTQQVIDEAMENAGSMAR